MDPKKAQGAKALRRQLAEELGRELQVAEDRDTKVILKRVGEHGTGNEDRYELERTGAQTLEKKPIN
jgi:ribosome biogenesis protein Tsr3